MDNKTSSSSKMTMEQLLAGSFKKRLTLNRGDEAEGEVIFLTDSEVILDLGAKSEGTISRKEFPPDQLAGLQAGEKIKAFVVSAENESGQILLSLFKQSPKAGGRSGEVSKKWARFVRALDQKKLLTGKVLEANKGGLMVEVEGCRGFVPSSQLSMGSLLDLKGAEDLKGLPGRELQLRVLEVDPGQNRLIFSARPPLDEKVKEQLQNYKLRQEVSGKITAVLPFALFLDLQGIEGVVFSQEVSWEPVENLGPVFSPGQEVEAVVLGVDENLGRVNLSIRQMSEDPLSQALENYQLDDVVSGTVTEVASAGISVKLEEGVEGFLPKESTDTSSEYAPGQKSNFLVAGVDKNKRRVNLAPFLTSTKGLIYK